MARAMGYRAVSLTDHETVCGTSAMRAAAREEGLGFIPGMEVHAHAFGSKEGAFHIVALDFDPEEPKMRAYLQCCAIWPEIWPTDGWTGAWKTACCRASAGRK